MSKNMDIDSVMTVLGYVHTLLVAGQPLPEGLRNLAPGVGPGERSLAERLARDLETGTALSDALGRHAPDLPPSTKALLRSGEAGGNLAASLDALIEFHRSSRKLARRLAASTAYPRMVLFVAIGLVLPVVVASSNVFQQMTAELSMHDPSAWWLLSRGYVAEGVGKLMGEALALVPSGWTGWLLLLGIATLLVRPVGPLRNLASRVVRRLYMVGPAIATTRASDFTTAVGLMLKARVPLPQAVQLVRDFTEDPLQRTEMERMVRQLEQGMLLSEALAGQPAYPRSLSWFAALGERGNNLDHCLLEAGRYYRGESEYMIEFLTLGLEPLLLVGFGLFVGPLVIGLFAPILRLINNVG
jgi:type IV pilus assembly protein PilC